MKIIVKLEYILDLPNCNINTITSAFKKLQGLILADIISQVLVVFGEYYMQQAKKPFSCKCGNCANFIWKTKNAKWTKIMTIFCEICLPQMQIQCKDCGKKMFITRILLEIKARCKMSSMTQRVFALVGSLATFRVSEKIVGMLGVTLNKMAIWRCVQEEGKNIEFGVDPNESNTFQADGTGIPIKGITKRGKELKVFIQEKIEGGVKIAGLALGNYNGGWDKLFQPVIEQLKEFKEVLIMTDGDTNILKGLNNVVVFVQRCLWHIPHQAKFTMWEDKIKRKSKSWLFILSRLYNITTLPRLVYDESEIASIIKEKMAALDKLIKYCLENKYLKTYTYLVNARPDMFTAFNKKMNGKTTSLAERVMRTVNMRIDAGKWSVNGALNALKIRLAYYYNGFDVENDSEEIKIEKIN